MIEGVQYIVDEKGRPTAVVIDLKEHGDLWEDFYDRALAESRRDEPREALESVRGAVNDFRNTRVAHQEKEFTQAKEAKKHLGEWINALVTLVQTD